MTPVAGVEVETRIEPIGDVELINTVAHASRVELTELPELARPARPPPPAPDPSTASCAACHVTSGPLKALRNEWERRKL